MTALSYTLRHRISIQVPDPGAQDAFGEPVPGWTELRKARASIGSENGMSAIKGGAVTSTLRESFRLRWCTDVAPGMRVQLGAVNYSVLAVLPDRVGKRWVDLVCETSK